MGNFLKQSTSVTINLGPFVDSTDGNTEETGLTIGDGDVYISKNGADFAAKADTTDPAHQANGWYHCVLGTGDTDTLGILQVRVHVAGALTVWREFMVVTANWYDSMCSTDVLDVSLTQMGGVAQSATDLKDFADTGYDPSTHKVQGVVLTDTCTTNTDMVTDVSANVTSILADTNELQTDLTTGGRLDLLVDAIKAKTDNLPTDPADESALEALLNAIAGDVTIIKKLTNNGWAYVGTTYTVFDDDKTTPYKTYTLDSDTAPTSRTED